MGGSDDGVLSYDGLGALQPVTIYAYYLADKESAICLNDLSERYRTMR